VTDKYQISYAAFYTERTVLLKYFKIS